MNEEKSEPQTLVEAAKELDKALQPFRLALYRMFYVKEVCDFLERLLQRVADR